MKLRLLASAAATFMAASALFAPTAGAVTHAGDSIQLTAKDGSAVLCTLTDVRTDNNGRDWGVTAAHCFADRDTTEVKSVTDGQILAGPEELKELKVFTSPDNSLIPPKVKDVSVFPLRPGTEVDKTSIHSYPTNFPIISDLAANNPLVAAFNKPMPLGEPAPVTRDLVGKPACQEGGSLGRTCGVIIYAEPADNTVVAVVPTIQGDSGGPLHVMGADGKRHVVGALSGGTVLLVNSFSNPSGYDIF